MDVKRFYLKEFKVKDAIKFVLRHDENPVFAIKIKDNPPPYLRKYRRRGISILYLGPLLSYYSAQEIRKIFAHMEPEGVYYWRNRVKDYDVCRRCPYKKRRDYVKCFSCSNFRGQELAFDIDFDRGVDYAKRGRNTIEKRLPFREKVSVFSGGGYHVHVFDEEAYYLSLEERKWYARIFERFIDPWVTAGNATLIRLPYTYNLRRTALVIPLYHSSSSSQSKSSSSSSNHSSSSSSSQSKSSSGHSSSSPS